MSNRLALASLLFALLVKAQVPDFKPGTPLLGAVLTNNTEALKKLLEDGANPNEGRFFGIPALFLPLVNGNRPMIDALLSYGADPRIADARGTTALMWAVGGEHPDLTLIDEFVKRGADPNAVNNLGESALTWARRRGDVEAIAKLKAAGASDAAVIRQSVEKAVALLQKSGPQFVKVSGCTSCHHQSLPQMAYAEARQRGFAVDPAISDQQVKAVMAMFKPIRKQMEDGTLTFPNPGISVSYSLLGVHAEGYKPDETTRAMTKQIERTQLPDGSFAVLPARPPMEASAITAAALSIRALQVYGEEWEPKVERAKNWLKKAKAATGEDRAMRLLGLTWAKASDEDIDRAATELLREQRPDGGWSQLENLESDAWATGEALVALHNAGKLGAGDKAWERGIAYLLRTQLPDGSWLVRSRSNPFQALKDSGFPHGRDQWISAGATSWAAMALAVSQPTVATEAASGLN